MSKISLPFFAVVATVGLSACTVVQDTNYKLYKTRLQAESYLLGRKLKPLPHPRARVRRISAKNQQYCPPSSKKKIKVLKGKAYQVKKVVRKKRVQAHRAKVVYRAKKPVVRRYIASRKARAVYKPRVVARKYIPPVRTSVVYRPKPRPVVHRSTPVQRPVAPQIPVNELNDRLFDAAKSGNVTQINRLLDQGAQVNAKNATGETALHAAAALGRTAAVGLLLQKGANPNTKTSNGWTPLHSAARFRHAQVASLLVSRGASLNVRNSQGKTPVALAQQVGASAAANVLIGLGGR